MRKIKKLILPTIIFTLALGVSAFATTFLLKKMESRDLFRGSIIASNINEPELVEVDIKSLGGPSGRRVFFGKYEVTVDEFKLCVDEGGCPKMPKLKDHVKGDHPVTNVNWTDATSYVKWLSKKTNQNYRLPLNSEWSLVAKGFVDQTVKKLFDDPRLEWAADYINFGNRPPKKTKSVTKYAANKLGIFGLKGNVWEWTNTCWRKADIAHFDPSESQGCAGVRILQGIHKANQSEFIRSVKIGGCSIGFAPSNLGFRVVKEVPADNV